MLSSSKASPLKLDQPQDWASPSRPDDFGFWLNPLFAQVKKSITSADEIPDITEPKKMDSPMGRTTTGIEATIQSANLSWSVSRARASSLSGCLLPTLQEKRNTLEVQRNLFGGSDDSPDENKHSLFGGMWPSDMEDIMASFSTLAHSTQTETASGVDAEERALLHAIECDSTGDKTVLLCRAASAADRDLQHNSRRQNNAGRAASTGTSDTEEHFMVPKSSQKATSFCLTCALLFDRRIAQLEAKELELDCKSSELEIQFADTLRRQSELDARAKGFDAQELEQSMNGGHVAKAEALERQEQLDKRAALLTAREMELQALEENSKSHKKRLEEQDAEVCATKLKLDSLAVEQCQRLAQLALQEAACEARQAYMLAQEMAATSRLLQVASKEEDLEERQAALTLKEIRMAQLLIECETLRARQDSEREFQRKENASAASDLLSQKQQQELFLTSIKEDIISKESAMVKELSSREGKVSGIEAMLQRREEEVRARELDLRSREAELSLRENTLFEAVSREQIASFQLQAEGRRSLDEGQRMVVKQWSLTQRLVEAIDILAGTQRTADNAAQNLSEASIALQRSEQQSVLHQVSSRLVASEHRVGQAESSAVEAIASAREAKRVLAAAALWESEAAASLAEVEKSAALALKRAEDVDEKVAKAFREAAQMAADASILQEKAATMLEEAERKEVYAQRRHAQAQQLEETLEAKKVVIEAHAEIRAKKAAEEAQQAWLSDLFSSTWWGGSSTKEKLTF